MTHGSGRRKTTYRIKNKKTLDFKKELLYLITNEVTDKGVKQLGSDCLSSIFLFCGNSFESFCEIKCSIWNKIDWECFKCIKERKKPMKEKTNVTEIFGMNVFNDSVMKARLPKAVYKDLKKPIE